MIVGIKTTTTTTTKKKMKKKKNKKSNDNSKQNRNNNKKNEGKIGGKKENQTKQKNQVKHDKSVQSISWLRGKCKKNQKSLTDARKTKVKPKPSQKKTQHKKAHSF